MTDRDRLKAVFKKIKYKPFQTSSECDFATQFTDYALNCIIDECLANGIIVVPCKYGDTIYCDGKYFASHCEGEIMSFPVNLIETTVSSLFRGEPDVCFDFESFGKTVFLTREEAEAKLKEMKANG